jgi:dehydrogenase/reductase SDR family protein 7B
MSNIDGKVVWLTGASSGIGEALARELSRRGARLVLSARREPELERVRLRCERPDEHQVLPLDLAAPEQLGAACAQVLERWGHIDFLINNAGVSQRAKANETRLEVDRRIMEINYFSAVALTKAVLPSMLARRSGHVVVISSVIGKIHTPLRSAYAASKHALQGFFSCLRDEVYDQGLRVTIVSPGFVKTDISKSALRGDGSTHDRLDEAQQKAMSPERFALRCVDAIERDKSDVMIGGGEVWLARLAPLLPGLCDYIVRRARTT